MGIVCRPTTQVEAALATAVLGPPRRGLVAYPVCPPTSPMRVHQLGLSQSLWENWGIGFAEKMHRFSAHSSLCPLKFWKKLLQPPWGFRLVLAWGCQWGLVIT